MMHVILFEPETSGNVGAVARVMKNFGFDKLILINPKIEIDDIAIARSKHAKDVLTSAKIEDEKILDKYDILIGTTAKTGTDYNIERSPMDPRELAAKVSQDSKAALLIGREGIGLTNDELSRCDFSVTIPADEGYPTLNISHALGIILYELYLQNNQTKSNEKIEMMGKKDKDVLMEYINASIENMDFSTDVKKELQKKIFKRFVGKAMLTKREAFALIGYFKKAAAAQKER